MWRATKRVIRKFTPRRVKEFFSYEIGDEFATKVYSQEGEDILLKRIFDHSPPGFYIDVGAHHPFRFSNTRLLYDKGWHGINIEANPDVYPAFVKWRKRDINLSMGIAAESNALTYYKYKHPALNTFNANVVESKIEKPVSTEIIPVNTLENVLDNHLPENQIINLLTIDVEGMDFDVLLSNDWVKYQPKWICVELPELNFEELLNSKIYIYLKSHSYNLVSKLWKSCIFKKL